MRLEHPVKQNTAHQDDRSVRATGPTTSARGGFGDLPSSDLFFEVVDDAVARWDDYEKKLGGAEKAAGSRYSAVMTIPATRPLGPAVAGWSDFWQVMAISSAARWKAV